MVTTSEKLPVKLKIVAALIFWLLFLLVDILKKDIFSQQDKHYVYAFYFFGFFVWICLSFPLFSFFQKTNKLPPYARFFVLLFTGPMVGTLKVIISWMTYYLSYSYSFDVTIDLIEFFSIQSLFHYVEASIITWIVLLLFFLSELYLKYRTKSVEAAELKSKLVEAQLQTLKMQLQPHFLFNAHNTLTMLIRTKMYDQAINMIARLSELLRASLNESGDQFITLQEEIDLVKKYLDIEIIRFEDTLDVTFEIAPDCKNAKVPNMILQPIVENAVKHGISKHLGRSWVRIDAIEEKNQLKVKVSNSGPRLKANFNPEKEKGIGLQNVLSRLKQSYNDNFHFELKTIKSGVCCQITIPMKF